MDKIYDYLVIGSGPSALAFLTSEKLKRYSVCLVDSSIRYKSTYEKHLSESDLYDLHLGDKKSFYGQIEATDYSMEIDDVDGLTVSNSFMLGGLSNVWGGATEVFNKNVLKKMGIFHDLKNSQQEMTNLLKVRKESLTENSLIKDIYTKIAKECISIKPVRSKLAINSECVKCGSCMYGCVYGAIFNSKHEYDRLAASYNRMDGYFAEKIITGQNFNVVKLVHINSLRKYEVRAKKIVIACGPINTARLILRSFDQVESIRIADSQSFYIPMLSKKLANIFRKQKKDSTELSKFYLKSKVGSDLVHGQIYTFGPFLRNHVRKILGIRFLPKIFFANALLYQGFLSSEKSSSGKMIRSGTQKIIFKVDQRYDKDFLRLVISNIKMNFKKAGVITFSLFKKIVPIYGAYHFGAIQVARNGKNFRPDPSNGTIEGLPGIHLVDASVFHYLPSGPLTQVTMANSRYIADNIL